MTNETTHLGYLDVEIPDSGYNVGYGTPGADWSELYLKAFQQINDDLKAGSDAPFDSPAFINVAKKPYNAPENGNGDGTAAIQQAIDDLPANGGTLFFPYMVRTTDTLDVTDRRNIRFRAAHGNNAGEATFSEHETGGIVPRILADKPAIDMTGAHSCVFSDGFAIYAPLGSGNTYAPNVGILMARSTNDGTPNGHHFNGARLYGEFTVAAIYNVSKEVGAIRDSYLTNTHDGGQCVCHTNSNRSNISSPYATIDPLSSATEWFYASNTINKFNQNGEAVRICEGTAGHYFFGNYWFITPQYAVVFDSTDGNTVGPYTFWNPRMEGGGDPGAFIGKTGGGLLEGVTLDGGRITAGTHAMDLRDTAGSSQHIYYRDVATDFRVNNGIVADDLRYADIHSIGGGDIEVANLEDSRIRLFDADATVSVSGQITGSDIRTRLSSDEYRYNYGNDGTVRFIPRGSAPANAAEGDVRMQDGSGWNPTGSGTQELVVFDGSGWIAATQASGGGGGGSVKEITVAFENTIGFAGGQSRSGMNLATHVSDIPSDKRAIPFIYPSNSPGHYHGYRIDSLWTDQNGLLRLEATETENAGNDGIADYGLLFE